MSSREEERANQWGSGGAAPPPLFTLTRSCRCRDGNPAVSGLSQSPAAPPPPPSRHAHHALLLILVGALGALFRWAHPAHGAAAVPNQVFVYVLLFLRLRLLLLLLLRVYSLHVASAGPPPSALQTGGARLLRRDNLPQGGRQGFLHWRDSGVICSGGESAREGWAYRTLHGRESCGCGYARVREECCFLTPAFIREAENFHSWE